jgi:hypothetical protein
LVAFRSVRRRCLWDTYAYRDKVVGDNIAFSYAASGAYLTSSGALAAARPALIRIMKHPSSNATSELPSSSLPRGRAGAFRLRYHRVRVGQNSRSCADRERCMCALAHALLRTAGWRSASSVSRVEQNINKVIAARLAPPSSSSDGVDGDSTAKACHVLHARKARCRCGRAGRRR